MAWGEKERNGFFYRGIASFATAGGADRIEIEIEIEIDMAGVSH